MQQAIQQNTATISILKVVFGALALWAGAEISIPIKPVPITLHTLVVMIIGLIYTPKLAISTISTYVMAGALGVPVFNNFQSGLPYMMGPTGGYILGLWLCCSLMPYLKNDTAIRMFVSCLLGQALIYIPGVLWLSSFVGLEAAVYKGFWVYIPSGLIKMAILVSAMHYLGLVKKR